MPFMVVREQPEAGLGDVMSLGFTGLVCFMGLVAFMGLVVFMDVLEFLLWARKSRVGMTPTRLDVRVSLMLQLPDSARAARAPCFLVSASWISAFLQW